MNNSGFIDKENKKKLATKVFCITKTCFSSTDSYNSLETVILYCKTLKENQLNFKL